MTQTKKRFGQHFLSQPNTISKIIYSFNLAEGEPLIEIGPGMGAMTKPLLENGHPMTVIEIDRDLIAKLKEIFANNNLTIIEQDVLKVDITKVCEKAACHKIVGNLPYNISTPILFHLLNFNESIDEMVFMLQKEVVDRICASNSCKNYGRLSVMIQQSCVVEALFDVSPQCFSPPPKVMSSMIRLIPYTKDNNPFDKVKNYENFSKIVRLSFGQRRKTLRNALKNELNEQNFLECGIDPQSRAEKLEVNDFIKLSNML
jgi:16S rRNA (adenine1518-N6/adenine1519-N6)-dimethyltransferase